MARARVGTVIPPIRQLESIIPFIIFRVALDANLYRATYVLLEISDFSQNICRYRPASLLHRDVNKKHTYSLTRTNPIILVYYIT